MLTTFHSRIDLRPATSATNPTTPETLYPAAPANFTDMFPPPLNDADPSSHRASRRLSGMLWDILNPQRMAGAAPAERIAALRRLRESRRTTHSPQDEAEERRRRRLTARFQEAFSIRTRPTAGVADEGGALDVPGSADHGGRGGRGAPSLGGAASNRSASVAPSAERIVEEEGEGEGAVTGGARR